MLVNDNANNNVGIIGCGWLGKTLAEQLQVQNYHVKVTVRSSTKQATLIDDGFDCECLNIVNGIVSAHSIFSQHTLIIAITPGFKRGLTDYASNIANIVTAAEAGAVKKIILISSTGIYQAHQGDVDEDTLIEDITSGNTLGKTVQNEKVTLLAQAEQAVITLINKA